jgi:hypothetical protein
MYFLCSSLEGGSGNFEFLFVLPEEEEVDDELLVEEDVVVDEDELLLSSFFVNLSFILPNPNCALAVATDVTSAIAKMILLYIVFY